MDHQKWIAILFFFFLFSCHASHNNRTTITPAVAQNVVDSIRYYPLQNEDDLDVLIKEIGDANIVLLGESTHGTHEYYTWRTAITKKLITEKGFDFVAVEGDWTDSYKIDQFIKGPSRDSAAMIEALKQYDRWPSSMWGNYEMAALLQWMNNYNQDKPDTGKIGFYGLDLYSFWEWTEQGTIIQDAAIQNAIKKVKDFFAVYKNDAMRYADSLRHLKPDGSMITKHLWDAVQKFTGGKQPKDEPGFILYQQAWLSLDGERYFRTMISDRVKAINLRDGHMAETIKRLLGFYGPGSKAVIWVHNGHAGDARYSSMGSSGYTSVGEILRNAPGHDKVFSVGFGTYKGAVIAGYSWNMAPQKQIVLPAKAGTWEYLLHKQNAENKIILSKDLQNNTALNKWIEFRSIGAAYDGAALYSLSIIPKRFDAFIFIDSTTALHPIENFH
jgi:erythromycin esterase-like protein